MKNIKKFNTLLNNITESILELAKLYYADLKRSGKAEDNYVNKTPLTRTMLRRLVHIAKGDILPQSFFIVNATCYNMLSTMSTKQQEKCINDKIELVAEDGSHWSKKFEDLSPRQMNMVYDQRAKTFRSDTAQREWLINNPVVKISHKGELKPVETEAPKEPTKSVLIKKLKALHIDAKDLSKLADASTLMQAAQLALKVKA